MIKSISPAKLCGHARTGFAAILGLSSSLTLLSAFSAAAFVTLDTSLPDSDKHVLPSPAIKDSAGYPPFVPGDPESPAASAPKEIPPGPERPHCGVVLFLSADDYEVYGALGVVAAMQAYDLRPDCLVGESRAALVAAGFALGYPANHLDSLMLGQPQDGWILPYYRPHQEALQADFSAEDDPPWPFTWSGQTLHAAKGPWHGSFHEPSEYLHVAWDVMRLAFDAPAGSVADMEKTPIPLAIQVFDADKNHLRTVTHGDLQDLLKASLLPAPVARDRSALRPFSDGSQVSAHDFNTRQLPFQFDQVVVLRVSQHLPRILFGGQAPAWRDSLEHGYRENHRRQLDSLARLGKVKTIDLEADAMGKEAMTPRQWRDLGYQAALKHMDILLQLMRPDSQSAPAMVQSKPSHPPRTAQVMVDPLASGGREVLLDLLDGGDLGKDRASDRARMQKIMGTGFYSQLDVDWNSHEGKSEPQWIFSAKEHSKLEAWASPRMAWTPGPLALLGPEVLSGISWSEPYFIPVKFEAMAGLGGHRPGWALQAFAQTLAPLPMRSGMRHASWDLHYPDFGEAMPGYGLINYRLREKKTALFLDFGPDSRQRWSTEISVRNLRFKPALINPGNLRYFAYQEDLDSLRTLIEANTEFCIGCGSKSGWPGLRPGIKPGLRLHYRTAQNINEGQVKPIQHVLSMQEWVNFPYAKLFGELVWSNYPDYKVDLYDYHVGPQIHALSFSDQYFLLAGRGLRFMNARAEILPRLGKLQGRAALGWIKHDGSTIMPEQGGPGQPYWEMGLAYPTPLGPLRAGLGAIDDFDPLYVIQIGVNANLLRALDQSRL